MRFSAPGVSSTTRESIPEATLKAIRLVMFALIRPVTTLVEGKVQLKKGNEQVILSPNQQAIWSDDEFRVKQVDARNFVLWKERVFYFEDVDLETILDDMARWYNVNIFYMNPTLKKMKFSVEIRRYGDINEILRRIEQTKRVKFEIKDRTINVYE